MDRFIVNLNEFYSWTTEPLKSNMDRFIDCLTV